MAEVVREDVKLRTDLLNLQWELDKANRVIKEMTAEFERIGAAGLQSATVVAIEGKYAILSNGIYAMNKDYAIGESVLCFPKTGQVVETTPTRLYGAVVEVEKVDGGGGIEIRVNGNRVVIAAGGHDLKAGDMVLIDQNCSIVLALWERAKSKVERVEHITWDDIGGQYEAKQLLQEAIELPYKHPALWQAYGKGHCNGILLHGEPGNGKTMLGKAIANSIGSSGGFISIKGPEVLNEYVGVSEAKIRAAFRRATAHKEATNKPAVIFIDEAEALLTKRGTHHNYMGQTIIPTFLAEMDGLEISSAIVVLSTNRPDMLDPAIIRDGRIDHQVAVAPPQPSTGKEIFEIYLSKKPIKKGHDRANIVAYATQTLFGAKLKTAVSGAMIAGCVEKAITAALRRDMAAKAKLASGLCEADFTWAVEQCVQAKA